MYIYYHSRRGNVSKSCYRIDASVHVIFQKKNRLKDSYTTETKVNVIKAKKLKGKEKINRKKKQIRY